MTTFLLVRHGETNAVDRTIMGWQKGWHLNARGLQQVLKLADALASRCLHAVYTSPLERAVETAEPIAQRHGLSPEPMFELGELRLGEWEGMSLADLEQRDDWRDFNTRRSLTRPPGGELMIEAQARMLAALTALCRRHFGQTAVVVSHGDPLRSVIAYCLGASLDMLQQFEIRPGSLSIVEMAEWGSRVRCLNWTVEVP